MVNYLIARFAALMCPLLPLFLIQLWLFHTLTNLQKKMQRSIVVKLHSLNSILAKSPCLTTPTFLHGLRNLFAYFPAACSFSSLVFCSTISVILCSFFFILSLNSLSSSSLASNSFNHLSLFSRASFSALFFS